MKVICSKYKGCTGNCTHKTDHDSMDDICGPDIGAIGTHCHWSGKNVICVSSRKIKLKQITKNAKTNLPKI